ncbi:Heat shock 70 kDa protein 12B [Fusarium oxysporum f. sp. cubense]|uniref:Heat shock 70 kDa protein 12B n=1 Tax=Fusarium oxysporum f. sp. cubense TaxID=61366 RepID=A0A559KSH1_FUSOC|nr:Heat shock 70 kDa protein 12B [Fusarium oxysporum f. sp. cubense]
MDPVSIAAGAAGLAVSCATIVKTIYCWIDDTVDIDDNVSSLCDEITTLSRVLDSISNASVQVPVAVIAEIDPDNGLWGSLRTTLDDVKATFKKLNQLLAELEKSSSFVSRGFLRRPNKQITFSLRSKEITTYKDRIKSYNTAMTSALQMINVCLLIQSNSSQDSMFKVLSSLKSQVERVEFALHTNNLPSPAGLSAEDDCISRNLRQFVQVANKFHSSASIIVGTRSTVCGGSILGEPLTQAQISRIEEWIPPFSSEENFSSRSSIADGLSRGSMTSDNAEGLHSDSGSDIDKDLTKRLEDLAIQNQRSEDYAKAEQFYRSAINRAEASHRPSRYVVNMRVQLAYACMRQEKWTEAEEIMAPIAFERRANDVLVYHGMHALALVHLGDSNLDAADRCCKRALWGKRKMLGKEDASCWDTVALLASICDAKNDVAEAEAHRSFIPPTSHVVIDADALGYLDRTVVREKTTSALVHIAQAGMSNSQSSPGLQQEDARLTPIQPSEISGIPRMPVSRSVAPQPLTPPQNVFESGNPHHESYDINHPQMIRGIGATTTTSTHQYSSTSRKTVQATDVLNPTSSRLFVGIYFGTEHCAVSYSFNTSMPADVGIITKWPGSSGCIRLTVPAVLYYDQYQKVVGWGYNGVEALDPKGHPKLGIQKLFWIKLYLGKIGNRLDSSKLPPLPPDRNAIDVSADYFHELRLAIRTALLEALGNTFLLQEGQIHWCFTIPRTWDQGPKAALRTAIERAGYLQDENDKRLSLFSQTEASIFYCLRTHLITLERTHVFIVADCGRGRVDLSAYEMVAETPFTLTELTAGLRDKCGSLALDRHFSHILQRRIQRMGLSDGHKTADRIYLKATREFEHQIKLQFRNDGREWLVDVGTETDYPEADIKGNDMIFTNEEVLSCFQPTITRILEMINHQIDQIWKHNRCLQAVVVTGEFSSSDYLFEQIEHHVLAQTQTKVVRPADPLLARAKGAVMAGISRSTGGSLYQD